MTVKELMEALKNEYPKAIVFYAADYYQDVIDIIRTGTPEMYLFGFNGKHLSSIVLTGDIHKSRPKD